MSPNGAAPNFKDTPQALAAIWAHVCVIKSRVSALPCKERGATIEANKAAVATLEAQSGAAETHEKATTARWKMALDVGWKVAVLIAGLVVGGKTALDVANGAPPAPPAPHVTTAAGG